MRNHIEQFIENDQSFTVELDLSDYLPLFLRANGQGKPLNDNEEALFNEKFAQFSEYFAGLGASDTIEDIKDAFLARYTPEEQSIIQNSPAFNFMSNCFIEVFKNTIDSFLQHYLNNPTDPNTKISLNINLIARDPVIGLSFSDSGPGFPPDILNLKDEKKQLDYIEARGKSKKRSGPVKYVGLMGGAGRGLRDILCPVITGELLEPGIKPQRPEGYESKIRFSNDTNSYFHGASIEIITQIAPIPDLQQEESPHSLSSISFQDSTRTTNSPLSSLQTSSPSSFMYDSNASNDSTPTLELSIETDDSVDQSKFSGTSPDIKARQSMNLSIDTTLSPFDLQGVAGQSPNPNTPNQKSSSKIKQDKQPPHSSKEDAQRSAEKTVKAVEKQSVYKSKIQQMTQRDDDQKPKKKPGHGLY
jgi:hypothetical protein